MRHLEIVRPCDQRWDRMQGGAQLRYCAACAREVHDLSAMREIEAHAFLLLSASRPICVRVARDEDGEIIFAPPLRGAGQAAPTPLWSGLAAAAMGMAAAGCAPVAPPPAAVTVEPPAPPAPMSAPTPSVAIAAPPPDRDGDAIPDDVDACPDQPGKLSPDPKHNGCPNIVVVTMGEIVAAPPAILFARGARGLDSKSRETIDMAARILREHPEIKRLAVKGHASTDEPDAKKLAEARAKAVIAALVAANIDVGRLVAESHGSEQPIADNATKEGRTRNRRVELQVRDPSPSCPTP